MGGREAGGLLMLPGYRSVRSQGIARRGALGRAGKPHFAGAALSAEI
jgi:hypothetical protein